MSLFGFVLAALVSLPISRHDRAPELAAAKAVQRLDVAVAITSAAESAERWPGSRRELAALLLAVGQAESAFALHVSRGDLKPWEGDPLHGQPQSVGPWQFKAAPRGATDPAVWSLARTDVHVAAREAARLLTRARLRCMSLERAGIDWVEMAVASYSGRNCRGWFRGIEIRVSLYSRLMARREARS